jgi:ribosomal protein S19
MATVAACGFECGVPATNSTSAHNFNNNGTTAISTTTVRPGGGARSIKVTCNGSSASAHAAFFTSLVAAGSVRVLSFYVHIETSLPAANAELFRLTRTTATRAVAIGFDQATSKLCIYSETQFASRVLGPVIAHSTWYRIDLRVESGTANWQVDGAAQSNLTIGGTAGTYSYPLFGHNTSADVAFTAYAAYYDDVVMSATTGDYPLADSFIVGYVPNADGSHNTGAAGNFTNAAGTNITNATTDANTYLDEIPSTTTDRVEQRLDTSGNLYVEVRFNSTGAAAAPLSVDFSTAYRTATAANAVGSIKMRDNLGTTDDAIVNAATINSATDLYLAKHYAARPAALGAWTQGALQDIRARVGFGTDVTPDLWFGGIIAEARFAVTAQTVTPATLALVTATFAPTVTATNHQTVTPNTASLTTALFAPVIALAVTPSTASLALSAFAPTVAATQHQLLTPDVAGLTLATFAPTVTASAHQAVTPTTAALTLATFAPTVASPVLATPDALALTLTTFAPTVSATAHQTATPDTATLTLSAFAPVVAATAHQTVTPDAASLALSAFAPTVSATAHVTATPDTAALVLETFAPAVTAFQGQTVVPTTASLVTEAFAPSVAVTQHQLVTPDAASLALTAFAPGVTASDHKVATPDPATLSMTAFAPDVVASDHQIATPLTAELLLAAFAPSVAVQPPDQPGSISMSGLVGSSLGTGIGGPSVATGHSGGRLRHG